MTIGTILFNPFTGQPRHPSDIASDPKGLLLWDGEEPLRAAQAAQPAQVPDYREIADCVLAGLEDRKGVLNLNVDTDIEEEIRQEVADNIRMMLSAAPSTKEES